MSHADAFGAAYVVVVHIAVASDGTFETVNGYPYVPSKVVDVVRVRLPPVETGSVVTVAPTAVMRACHVTVSRSDNAPGRHG